MKINTKFYQKYATNPVILPPPLESEEGEESIPRAENKVPENLQKLLLLVQDEGKTFEDLERGNMSKEAPGGLLGKEEGTVRPGKKNASVADIVLAKCDAYYRRALSK